MPTIKVFSASKICMYFADHGEPHFHVLGPDGALVVRIEDMTVIEGNSRRVKASDALAWAAANRGALRAAWDRMQRSRR